MGLIMVYVTCKDRSEARNIANQLLKKKLIACANLFPAESIYRWKGKAVDERETALLLKSTEQKFGKIKEEVKRLHSYEIPCIERIVTTANRDYEHWVARETR
jgi:periplasmic divalent cation tolerance protein